MSVLNRLSSRNIHSLRRLWDGFQKRKHDALNLDSIPHTVERVLPSLDEFIPTLPTTLHTDAKILSDTVNQAQSAIHAAAQDGSDHEYRNDAFIISRRSLYQYNELVIRAADTMSKSFLDSATEHSKAASSTTTLTKETFSQQSNDSPAKTPEGMNTSETSKKSTATDDEAPSPRYYVVPKVNDAMADEIVNNSNPVIRAFGPHIADIKYNLFMSRRQRVWIGWNNWF